MPFATCPNCGRSRRYHGSGGLCGLFLYDGASAELMKVPNEELRELTNLDLASLVKLLRSKSSRYVCVPKHTVRWLGAVESAADLSTEGVEGDACFVRDVERWHHFKDGKWSALVNYGGIRIV